MDKICTNCGAVIKSSCYKEVYTNRLVCNQCIMHIKSIEGVFERIEVNENE